MLRVLVAAGHPEPTAVVTAVACALAISTGRDLPGVLVVGAAVAAGQLSVGWSNDAQDAHRDARAGRRDKPAATGLIGVRTLWTVAGVAAALCVPLSLASGAIAGALHLLAVAAAWSYNLRLKSSRLSVLPYLVAFGLLPAYVVHGLPGGPVPPPWLLAAGAGLGAGAHFANVLPDLDDDARTGVRGLPHLLGAAWSRVISAGCLLVASGALAFGPAGRPTAVGWAGFAAAVMVLGIGFALGKKERSRAPFRAVLAVAGIDVALLLVAGRLIG